MNGTDPGFIDAGLQNFRLTAGSGAINTSAALHPMTTAAHVPLREYRKSQQSDPRRPLGEPDLGAFEFSPYAAWRGEEFGPEAENDLVSGESADPDGDRISNLLEFAFQLDPQLPSSESSLLHPAWVSIGEEDYFAIEFQRRSPPTGLLYRIGVSDDLTMWSPGTVYSDAEPPTTTALTTDASEGGLTRTRLNLPSSSLDRGFMRLEVEYE